MSTIEDLSKIIQPECNRTLEKETLLSKYNIPINHFDFEYVKKCSDGKELEKILLILLSGEEGYYPELTKAAEKRLNVIKPKSKVLRKINPVLNINDLNKGEIDALSKDLENWVLDVCKNDRELESRKVNAIHHESAVRTSRKKTGSEKYAKGKDKRISAIDYVAWDKYDPDTELLKIEMEEEKSKKAFLEQSANKPKKSVYLNKFATEAEAIYISNHEKEKGNEFFKIGEYEEALQYYTASIESKANVHNLNNRAVTYLKLRQFENALNDCDKVLALEFDNTKAHFRKAEALENLARYEEALENIEFVIQKDPNNCRAQALAEKLRNNYCYSVKNTRMKIIEIE